MSFWNLNFGSIFYFYYLIKLKHEMKGNISITNEFKAPRKLLILTLIFANLDMNSYQLKKWFQLLKRLTLRQWIWWRWIESSSTRMKMLTQGHTGGSHDWNCPLNNIMHRTHLRQSLQSFQVTIQINDPCSCSLCVKKRQ